MNTSSPNYPEIEIKIIAYSKSVIFENLDEYRTYTVNILKTPAKQITRMTFYAFFLKSNCG